MRLRKAPHRHTRKNKKEVSFARRLLRYKWRIWLAAKLLLLSSLLIFINLSYFAEYRQLLKNHVYSYLGERLQFKLANIIIEGKKYTEEAQIIACIGHDQGANLLTIDLEQIRQCLENQAWVKSALVARRWPATLHIALHEPEPIAIWQLGKELMIIDQQGQKITPYQAHNHHQLAHLLHIVGPGAYLHAQQLVQDLERYPALKRLVHSAVRFGRRRWDLHLESGLIVKMPEKDFNDAYDYLNKLRQKKHLQTQKYSIIDLRDLQKIYLRQAK